MLKGVMSFMLRVSEFFQARTYFNNGFFQHLRDERVNILQLDQAPVPPLCSLMRLVEPYAGSVSSNFSWLKNWKENKKPLHLNCVKDKVCNTQILQIEGLPIPLLRGLILTIFELQSRGNGQ